MHNIRFVAHLDILGMSSIVERDADAAWELLSDLVAVRDKTNGLELEFLDTKERIAVSDAISSVTFSDTILLFTKGNSDTDLRCLIVLVTEIFQLALYKCVPIRAGISLGTFYFNLEKSMYAGPALVDAYKVGESAQWLGITLSSTVQKIASELNMTSGISKVVVPWQLPLKEETKICHVINWPAVIAHNFKILPPLSFAQFYQLFEHRFGLAQQLPSEVLAKYRNTVEFINTMLSRHGRA